MTAVDKEVAEDRPVRPGDDHYDTWPRVTRALLSVERFGGSVWECCAGVGCMAEPLRAAGHQVCATTIGDRYWPRDRPRKRVEGGVDFLASRRLRAPNLVTNPPFRLTKAILRHAFSLEPAKVCLFLNVKFLAGIDRKDHLFQEFPPARVWVFADRITMYPHGWTGKRNQTTETMAWFVWDAPFRRPNRMWSGGWLNSKEFMGPDDIEMMEEIRRAQQQTEAPGDSADHVISCDQSASPVA